MIIDDWQTFRLENSLGFVLHRTLAAVKAHVRRAFSAEDLDVTIDQWVLLCALWEADGISQAALTDRTFKDRPTVTRMLDLLEAKGVVTRRRSKADRRILEVHLTPKGRAFQSRLVPEVIALNKEILEDLDPSEVRQLFRLLDRVFKTVIKKGELC